MSTRTLTLLRHAKAVPAEFGIDDHARPLSARGRAAATDVGFATVGEIPQLVLCSDAMRTRETLAFVSAAWARTPPVRFERALYLAEPRTLLDRLATLAPDLVDVWIIGHNPGLEDLAAHLASRAAEAAVSLGPLVTAARVRFRIESQDWGALDQAVITRFHFWRPARG